MASFGSINRNILECKYELITVAKIAALVLIETYWNVNHLTCFNYLNRDCVLIETYWNGQLQ